MKRALHILVFLLLAAGAALGNIPRPGSFCANLFVCDPQIEFMELGVYTGPSGQVSNPGQMTWKLCGPDSNGRYGGMNGAGGLEATATGLEYFRPVINDAFWPLSTLNWFPSRPTGYGAVPGYRPLPLGHGGTFAESAAWRGRWSDVTGYIWRGARFYDPVAGMWLSPDPQWNDRDPSYWTYAGGDPINSDDWDGRCLRSANAQLGAFEDSFINGTVSLAQMAHYGAGDWIGMSHLVSQGEMLEGFESPMQRMGIYEPGSFDAQIGENAAVVAGAYGLARQIPSIANRVVSWLDSVWPKSGTRVGPTPKIDYANWGGEFIDDLPATRPMPPRKADHCSRRKHAETSDTFCATLRF